MRKNWFIFPLLAICYFMASAPMFATHNRAGEITYEQIGELTIRITIVTYTKSSSHVDRDSLIVFWGDGVVETIARSNGGGQSLENDIQKNLYIREHTYPGRGTYTIGMTDPNRIGGILNVNYPNSIRIRFHITTSFSFLSRQFQGENNSAILLQPPIDMGCVGKPFIHNPNAFDPDGDSLAYELIVPLQDVGTEVPNYLYPDQISPGDNNQLSLNELTGELIWNSPQRPGQYNIAIRIKEYRQGTLIGSIVRDMQIQILECENNPPNIEVASNVCVEAGTLIDLPVKVTDPEFESQKVQLSALGGPFNLDNSPAQFVSEASFEDVPRERDFIWQTNCSHVQKENYTVVFKAIDNFFKDTSGLVDLKTLNINIVGPAPPDVTIERDGNFNILSWSSQYICGTASNFQGYTVWRRIGSSNIPDDICLPDLNNYNYEIVGFVDKNNPTNFEDETVQNGVTYCYRITARFAKTSAGNNPYNIVESKPSAEVCIMIQRDLPLLTKADVVETSMVLGKIDVEWIKPEINVDSTRKDDPYVMQLYHSTVIEGPYLPIADAIVTASNIDSFDLKHYYSHMGLNTVDDQHFYKVLLKAKSREIGFSSIASSIRLESKVANKRVNLNWNSLSPWMNFNYKIYKNIGGSFVEIGQSILPSFTDDNVVNGEEYCYKVEGEGQFIGISYPDTTYNFSQELCVVPDDIVPPCRPELTVVSNCTDNPNAFIFSNTLEVSLPDTCEDLLSDLETLVFYKGYNDQDFVEITNENSLSFINSSTASHSSSQGFAGCYTVRFVDDFGNVSEPSDTICVEACPLYILPNVFTPNADGSNDVYFPLRRAFVDQIQFSVFNRWGNLVFETQDPEINWDGSNIDGKEVETGTYTYRCDIFVGTERGSQLLNSLSGTIDVIR